MCPICLLTEQRLRQEGYHIDLFYLFLDVNSDPTDLVRARDYAAAFDIDLEVHDLSPWYEASPLLDLVPGHHPKSAVLRGNIKCRLRMIALYHIANQFGGIYVDTDDLSEDNMGFFTKHGDEGDVKVIQKLTKDEVRDLGEYLGVPQSILASAPGDGLGITANNLATDQLGLPYMYIDYIVSRMVSVGFDTDGNADQLNQTRFKEEIGQIALDLNRKISEVERVVWQVVRTSFKRRYGYNVAVLLPNRTELGLPEVGSRQFNQLYLSAIKASA